MGPLALLSLLRGRGSLYALLGLLLLSTLWVSSLTLISARGNATDLLTDVGAEVLNPFLAQQGLGITSQTYATLESQAKAQPSQPLALSVLKVQVPGSEIVNRSYDDGVRVIYGHVAGAYYDGGLAAAFTIPPALQQIFSTFGIFGSGSSSGSTTDSLPGFLQPFFAVIGLTPATFTASGHDSLLHLLPWFWVATLVVGAIALVFAREGRKIIGLAKTVTHSAWPIVLLLVGVWVASLVYATAFAPYKDSLGVVERTFLPVYGGALLLGLIGLYVPRLLAARQREEAREPVAAPVPGRTALNASPSSGLSAMGGMPQSRPADFAAPSDADSGDMPRPSDGQL